MAPKRARTTRANPDPTRTTTATEPMTQKAINNLIAQRVIEALAEYETQRNSVVNGDTSHIIGTGLRTENVPEESDEIERYVGGLPEMIRGNVMSYEPKSMQKAIEFANDQMDQKLFGIADQKKPYGGTKPLCPKCNFHHDGPCGPKCTNCKRTGHITRVVEIELLTPTTITTTTTTTTEGPQRHIKEFPLALSVELKARNGNVVARAYGVGAAGGNPDANVVM
nr:hypothetical protein [Tanacetum cinerariifolium]